MSRLTILRGGVDDARHEGAEVVSLAQLRVTSWSLVRWLWRYEEVSMIVPDLMLMTYPLLSGLIVRLWGRRAGILLDARGRRIKVTWRWIARRAARAVADVLRIPQLFRNLRREMAALDVERAVPPFDPSRPPLYMRTDLWSGTRAGGAVAHTAGVVNGLLRSGWSPIVFLVDPVPVIDAGAEVHLLPVPRSFWDLPEVPWYAMNQEVGGPVSEALGARRPSFIYQRCAIGSFAGLKLASVLCVPLVLEFNGSEVWISRHWRGRPFRLERFASRVEKLNLRRADLVVCVSDAMAAQARELGASEDRLIVVPNGVDPDVYHPAIDGSDVRCRYGLAGKTVVGFIGTFGAWHGAEVLAEAFGQLVERRPDLRDETRLLMIGDGMRMPEVREAIARHGVGDLVVLTGTVPQEEGPAHLAACDVLASPHVPNPDGTPFFGSPTKLFEYMAMGRGIVASDLDQIGEVLDHGETGWLVRPGDPDNLASGLERLVDDPELRARLGRAARERAVAEHTWTEHTRRILEALRSCVG